MHPLIPAWLREVIPPVLPAYVVDIAADAWTLTSPDGGVQVLTKGDFSTLSKLVSGLDYTMTPAFNEAYNDNGFADLGMIIWNAGNGAKGTLLSRTDKDRLRSLEYHFELSLRAAISYDSNPHDFYNSYRFVDSHPAFWRCLAEKLPDWHWQTNGHMGMVDLSVRKCDDGVYFAMETGAHVEGVNGWPGYNTFYHDPRLDSSGATYEECVINLAARVKTFHSPEGRVLHDTPWDKPAWLMELELRLQAAEAGDGHC